MEKICKRFNTIAIIENTNEISKKAAEDLWRSLEKHQGMREERNQANIQSYNNLMNKLTSLFSNNPL
jgi:hypothetical protein